MLLWLWKKRCSTPDGIRIPELSRFRGEAVAALLVMQARDAQGKKMGLGGA
jgi:hypothetical protein